MRAAVSSYGSDPVASLPAGLGASYLPYAA
jgi:hypothetical protein